MARRRREDQPGTWHHVMNRGADRQRIFFTRTDGLDFERLLGEGHDRTGVEVHAYCLMPNHFHLLVHCPQGDLGRFMQHVASAYTRRFNDRRGRDGALFRGRYHALTVRDERYLLVATRYIHRNPSGLAGHSTLAAYRWSSHAAYLGRRPKPNWLKTGVVLGHLAGGVASFADMVDDTTIESWASIPDDHLLDFIELMIDEHDPTSTGNLQKAIRTVALSLADQLDDETRSRIAAALDFENDIARKRAHHRASQRYSTSTVMQDLVDVIQRRAA